MSRDKYDQRESEFFPRRNHPRPSGTDRIVRSVFSDGVSVRVEDAHVGLKTATFEAKNNLLSNF